jgi:hypothetical protein
MRTLEIEIAIMEHYNIRRRLIIPNVTSKSSLVNFETDVLMLSNANYATGIEIKISKSDLKNDLKKKQWKALRKDALKREGDKKFWFKPFKHFYYCVPEGLVDEVKAQVPMWCGILVAYKTPRGKKVKIREERKPELLFNTKWSENSRYKLARLGALRILKYKKKLCIK